VLAVRFRIGLPMSGNSHDSTDLARYPRARIPLGLPSLCGARNYAARRLTIPLSGPASLKRAGPVGATTVRLVTPRSAGRLLRDGDDVFHTYSTYQRGLDLLLNTYNYLGLTPLGRPEEGNRAQAWIRHHDRYPVQQPLTIKSKT
jgi:uncharacterized protein DUF899